MDAYRIYHEDTEVELPIWRSTMRIKSYCLQKEVKRIIKRWITEMCLRFRLVYFIHVTP